jgi:hypothetical protein
VALNEAQVIRIAQNVMEMRSKEYHRLHRISRYMRGHHDSVYVPHGAKTEYKWLLERSVVNYLPLVVSVISENLHVDGYLSMNPEGEPGKPASPWQIFVANRLVSKQHGLHRSVAKYGVAYTVVLPGDPQPVIRPVSPRKLTALYDDDVDDEWPVYAVEERLTKTVNGDVRVVRLYDDANRYTLVGKPESPTLYWPSDFGFGDGGGSSGNDDMGEVGGSDAPPIPIADPQVQYHGLGVCPVVRFLHEIDLDGEMDVSGEVEPLIPIQDQVNTTIFDLLMAMQYAAFRQRWITGMTAEDEEGRPKEPFRMGVDRLLVAEDADTKFGEFSQTALADYLNSTEMSVRHMATIAQVPPYHLLGQVANLSADALAAARDGLDRKIEELQGVLSEPWKQTLQLASKAAGDDAGWTDTTSTIMWRDTSARAFAATVDALGKAAQMLGIPATELWHRIPGTSAEEVERWKAVATEKGGLAELNQIVEFAMTKGAQQTGPPHEGEPYQGPAMLRPTGV